jgi:hypothetical protein
MRVIDGWKMGLLGVVAMGLGCGGGSANLTIGVMPEGGSFHGVWQSPQYGNMHLCQTGSQVVGDYEKDERRGRIQGTIQGDTLRFTWEEQRQMVIGRTQTTRGRGYFQMTRRQDNDLFITGEWGVDDSETGGGPWNGVKLRRGAPERCIAASDQGGSNSSGGYDDDYGDDDYDDGSSVDSGGGGGSYQEDTDTDDLEGLDDF